MLAQTNLRRAIALMEELPAEFQKRPASRNMLALCHSQMAGDALQWEEAERHSRAAFLLCEQLAQEQPDNPRWQNELARAEHHLGDLCQFTNRLEEAKSHYLRSIAIRASLIAAHPEVEAYQAQLAETHLNLAVVYGLLHQPAEGRTANEKAIAVLRRLADRRPAEFASRLSLAAALSNAGQGLTDKGKPKAALNPLTQAIALAEAMLRQEPTHDVARTRSFSAHGGRAQAYERLGQWNDAAKDWDRVVELDRGPRAWLHRVLRALALARAGEHVRAVAPAQDAETDPNITDEGFYNLACAYALSVGPARSDAQLPITERDAVAERYAVSAVTLLQKLLAKGYFKDANHARVLATDTDLLALYGRPDFQRLLKLTAPAKT